ncbi:MAG: hypothetical protein Kow0042_13070 [Calditrichia bacterium]
MLFLLLTGIVLVVRYVSTQKLIRKLHVLEIQQKLQSERERISEELHDHIGARLSNIVTCLEIGRRYAEKGKAREVEDNLQQLERHTRSTIEELRNTIWSLNQETGTVEALVAQIRDFVRNCRQFSEIPRIQIHVRGEEQTLLTPLQFLNLFRISQEAMNNALKYSQSSCLELALEARNRQFLRLQIRDDGKGFDLEQVERNGGGYGLINIKKRAEKIGATIDLKSSERDGTMITLYLDLSSPEKHPI